MSFRKKDKRRRRYPGEPLISRFTFKDGFALLSGTSLPIQESLQLYAGKRVEKRIARQNTSQGKGRQHFPPYFRRCIDDGGRKEHDITQRTYRITIVSSPCRTTVAVLPKVVVIIKARLYRGARVASSLQRNEEGGGG